MPFCKLMPGYWNCETSISLVFCSFIHSPSQQQLDARFYIYRMDDTRAKLSSKECLKVLIVLHAHTNNQVNKTKNKQTKYHSAPGLNKLLNSKSPQNCFFRNVKPIHLFINSTHTHKVFILYQVLRKALEIYK